MNRFKNFQERLEAIQIVQFKLKDNDDESHFLEALKEQELLNLTASYGNFVLAMRKYSSLVLVLYHQAEIIDLLLAHLPDTLCLITALAKDLQEEFYPHFSRIFSQIVTLGNSVSLDIVESLFQNVTFLFKHLGKFLVNDICQIYSYFVLK